jgi:hypothetical protein
MKHSLSSIRKRERITHPRPDRLYRYFWRLFEIPSVSILCSLVGLADVRREIYEVILPEVVERLSHIQYWRGSPYGGKTSRDPTVGDIHQWNVWHGTQEPWSNWDKLQGRFVS